jgi:hypothetical protein
VIKIRFPHGAALRLDARGGARAVPSSLGVLLWPAANPSNPQNVNLIIAPLAMCQQLSGFEHGRGRGWHLEYIVGTAARLISRLRGPSRRAVEESCVQGASANPRRTVGTVEHRTRAVAERGPKRHRESAGTKTIAPKVVGTCICCLTIKT